MKLVETTGDLLDQHVEVLVNAWNRNVIPWWLLLPQGVSGALKRRAGTAPFRELARHGTMPLGTAVMTGAGRLPHRALIHVAGIDLLWRGSEQAIRDSVDATMAIVRHEGFASVALPLIGAGSGGLSDDVAHATLCHQLSSQHAAYPGEVRVVRFRPIEVRDAPPFSVQ